MTLSKMTSKANRMRVGIVVGIATIAALALSSAPALGAYDHSTVQTKFAVGNECLKVQDIAVLEPEGLIYVSCRLGTYPNEADQVLSVPTQRGPGAVQRDRSLHLGEQADRRPGLRRREIRLPTRTSRSIARLGQPRQALRHLGPERRHLQPDRAPRGRDQQPIETTIPNVLNGVEVGPDGSIYVTSDLPGPGRVSKYNTSLNEVSRAYPRSETFFGSTFGWRSITTVRSGSTPEVEEIRRPTSSPKNSSPSSERRCRNVSTRFRPPSRTIP